MAHVCVLRMEDAQIDNRGSLRDGVQTHSPARFSGPTLNVRTDPSSSDSDEESPPRLLEDDYLLLHHRLGTGAFSQVRLGIKRKGNDRVAVKLVPYNVNTTRTENEVNILRKCLKLQCPYLMRLLDFYKSSESYQLVLELLSSDSLMDRLQSNGPMGEEQARPLIYQISIGLRAIHGIGVIHRDLKPENIMFDADGNAKICDFGFAKQIARPSYGAYHPFGAQYEEGPRLASSPCGTPGFVAPEVFRKERSGYDFSVDLWALGVIMFMVLYGESPFSDNPAPPEVKMEAKLQGLDIAPPLALPPATLGESNMLVMTSNDTPRRPPSRDSPKGVSPMHMDASPSASPATTRARALLKNSSTGLFRFPSSVHDVSDAAKDLISELLQVEPSLRPSAAEVCLRPWATGTEQSQQRDETMCARPSSSSGESLSERASFCSKSEAADRASRPSRHLTPLEGTDRPSPPSTSQSQPPSPWEAYPPPALFRRKDARRSSNGGFSRFIRPPSSGTQKRSLLPQGRD
ncbi:hypothetical protein AB1Y20_005293 [Prymnesium parvum]|uniref:Protein kinase domain-containing protein n=1 Tax=Prymnesium parvum TaxID=97485 RepID=A0AB34J5U2_PRYPA